MNIQALQNVFLWCFILNIGIGIFWFLLFTFAHDRVYRLHSKWYKLSVERFDTIHYTLGTAFKVATFGLFLVPYLALKIVF